MTVYSYDLRVNVSLYDFTLSCIAGASNPTRVIQKNSIIFLQLAYTFYLFFRFTLYKVLMYIIVPV